MVDLGVPPDIVAMSFEDALAELEQIVRRLEGGRFYPRALIASLKIWPTVEAAGALLLYILSFGFVRK